MVGADLIEERLAGLTSEAESRGIHSARIMTLTGDVTSFESDGRLVEAAVQRFERLDILVNNAGGSLGFGDIPLSTSTRGRGTLPSTRTSTPPSTAHTTLSDT